MRVTRRKSKAENIQEVIQHPVLSRTAVLKFDLSGLSTSLLMLADLHIEKEVTITGGQASTKYKTKSDQDYLVPIALMPLLLSTVPL